VRLIRSSLRILALAAVCSLPLVAQHEASGHEAQNEDKTTFWKLANFAILAGLAGYLIYKKGGGFFTGRTGEIRKGLEEAAKLKAEAEARYQEVERRLSNLGVEIEALRERALQESSAETTRLREETDRELEKIHAQARQEILAAAKAARQRLRAYSAELAVGLAAGKIRDRLTPETDHALVASMVRDLRNRPADHDGRAS
jgi:F-type H+-transporting ATPase subunit b